MEDYIFILIALVLSALGAMNQNKKKRMQQMKDDEDHSEKRTSIFDQFFDDNEFEWTSPETVPPAAPEPMVAPEKMEKEKMERPTLSTMKRPSLSSLKRPSLGSMMERKPYTPVRRIKTSFSEEGPDTKTETSGASIMSDFSLKKAIIYSEILDRKY